LQRSIGFGTLTGMQTTPAESKPQHQAVRRQLCDGDADADAIAHLHFRIYLPEFARNQAFVNAVAANIRKAVAAGWPAAGGAVWLIDGDRQLSGALGLTHEGDGVGQVRWFVLDRSLRGQGWGGALLGELIDHARADGLHRLELQTFSALRAAGHLYRRAGFQLQWERERHDWGSPIIYQGYRLELG
jgi:RimJ/RimL family protein N-acetyltransferase